MWCLKSKHWLYKRAENTLPTCPTVPQVEDDGEGGYIPKRSKLDGGGSARRVLTPEEILERQLAEEERKLGRLDNRVVRTQAKVDTSMEKERQRRMREMSREQQRIQRESQRCVPHCCCLLSTYVYISLLVCCLISANNAVILSCCGFLLVWGDRGQDAM